MYSVPLQLVVVGCALFMQLKWRPYIAVKGRCGVCGSGLVKKISITCCRGANNRIEIILMVAECLLLISGFANAYVGDTTGLNSGMYGNGTNTTMMNNDNSFNGFNNGINTPSSSFADANGMDVEAVADLTPSSSSLEMYNMSLNNDTKVLSLATCDLYVCIDEKKKNKGNSTKCSNSTNVKSCDDITCCAISDNDGGTKTCADVNGEGGGTYDCSSDDKDLDGAPADIKCGVSCDAVKCCTITPVIKTCADIDGKGGGVYDCSSDDKDINASPADIKCGASCDAVKCCTVTPPDPTTCATANLGKLFDCTSNGKDLSNVPSSITCKNQKTGCTAVECCTVLATCASFTCDKTSSMKVNGAKINCLASGCTVETCCDLKICSVVDGSSANANDCRCGTVACDSAVGLYCHASSNKCSKSVIKSYEKMPDGCKGKGWSDRSCDVRKAVDELNADGTHPTYGPIEDWDMSEVTDLSGLGLSRSLLNADLSKWDVSKCTTMQGST